MSVAEPRVVGGLAERAGSRKFPLTPWVCFANVAGLEDNNSFVQGPDGKDDTYAIVNFAGLLFTPVAVSLTTEDKCHTDRTLKSNHWSQARFSCARNPIEILSSA